MKCPRCKREMKKVNFDIGSDINVESLHCKNCGFNVTDDTKLAKALPTLKKL